MNKRQIWALVIIGLLAVILVVNSIHGSRISINVVFTQIKCLQSIAYLAFTAIGVLIGTLLR